MSAGILLLVLAAAFIHAAWNAVVKGAGDRRITFGLVMIGHTFPAFLVLPFLPVIFPGTEALPYLALSIIVHWAYYYLLVSAYRFGDLSLVYPIARGTAPLLVAFGSLVFIGENLSLSGWIGLMLISCGILGLSTTGLRQDKPMMGVGLALATALTISTYSVVDGIGVRLADEALAYIAWLFILEGAAVAVIILPCLDRARQLTRKQVMIGLGGGVLAGMAYGMVLVAKTMAPIGMVSALRETSVVFAALIGMLIFGEGPVKPRLIAAVLVSTGIITMSTA